MRLLFSFLILPYFLVTAQGHGDTYVWLQEMKFILAVTATNGELAGKIGSDVKSINLLIKLYLYAKWPKPKCCNGPDSIQMSDHKIDHKFLTEVLEKSETNNYLINDQSMLLKDLKCLLFDSKSKNDMIRALYNQLSSTVGQIADYLKKCGSLGGCPLPGTGKPISSSGSLEEIWSLLIDDSLAIDQSVSELFKIGTIDLSHVGDELNTLITTVDVVTLYQSLLALTIDRLTMENDFPLVSR